LVRAFVSAVVSSFPPPLVHGSGLRLLDVLVPSTRRRRRHVLTQFVERGTGIRLRRLDGLLVLGLDGGLGLIAVLGDDQFVVFVLLLVLLPDLRHVVLLCHRPASSAIAGPGRGPTAREVGSEPRRFHTRSASAARHRG